jgi:hypothetical protein
MRALITFLVAHLFLIGCADAGNPIAPTIYQGEFPGFAFSDTGKFTAATLSGYEFQQTSGEILNINSCTQAEKLDLSVIPEFEYFRFRLLLVSCRAAGKLGRMSASNTRHFPAVLDKGFYTHLPADVMPRIGEKGFKENPQKLVGDYRKEVSVTMENDHSAKVLTADDEVYLTLLARGDLTGDGIEDLLVRSEWFARNAFGKHVDLLVLTRSGADAPVRIHWRMNDE